MKVFQARKNYAPWLSETTKTLRNERDNLKEQSISSQDPDVLRKYKTARNNIKSRNKQEKKEYYQDKFEKAKDDNDSKQVWNSAYEILGSRKDLCPTQLLIDGNLCSNPPKMANELNKVFIEKVKNLKNKLAGLLTIDPA